MNISETARFLGVALILAVTSQATVQAQTFIPHPNGVTVTCTAAAVGETGVVNGITYTKRTREQIIANRSLASTSCTSGITDMSLMFNGVGSFNEDISTWDVSSVTTMRFMFTGATAFNSVISDWDVSNVTDMFVMFQNAPSFNSDISDWDVSNVTDMLAMFENASSFNQNLSGWCVVGLPTQPTNFALNSGLDPVNYPLWGTCANPNFSLAANGVSVLCTVAAVGEIGTINGINYTKRTREQIIADRPLASTSCTSGITDMSDLFSDKFTFNEDISTWDVSSVTSMNSMFYLARAFNQNLSSWDVSNVTDMSFMFSRATGFNGNIASWDVSNVTDMAFMFIDAKAFDQSLSTWDVSNVLDMQQMFNEATAFNGDLSTWDVSAVTRMNAMFRGAAAFNGNLSTWDVSNVTMMRSMFNSASTFNRDLSSWDVSAVTDMGFMFYFATAFNQPLSSWDVSAVTDMFSMFEDATAFNQDISGWCVSQFATSPTNFNTHSALSIANTPVWGSCRGFSRSSNGVTVVCSDAAIGGTGTVGGVTYTRRTQITTSLAATSCTSGITDMNNLFTDATTFNADISTWDVSSVTNMNRMFYRAHVFNQNLSSWDVSSVTNMNQMFRDSRVFIGDISSWDVSNVTDMNSMFMGASAFNQDLSSWDVSNVTDMGGMFSAARAFNKGLNAWDVRNVTHMGFMFGFATAFDGDISTWDVSNVTNMGGMFNGASTFNADISTWDVSAVRDMNSMFDNATAFNQDLSSWDVRNVTSLSRMFFNAAAFDGDISTWNVSNVTDMTLMFNNAAAFNQDLSSWDVSAMTNLSRMFYNATAFNGDISTWDVSNVTNMSEMFRNASIFNGNLSSWDVSNVTDMSFMFQEARNFNGNISTWDVSAVTNMRFMFSVAAGFNGDLSTWDVSALRRMNSMFRGATAFNQDLSSWDVSAVTNMNFMFVNATAFNQDLSGWCVSHIAASTQTDFSTSSALISANTPVWGTCPVVQRVISGDAGWRLVSFPITGGKISDIADDTPIQGIAGGANPDAAPNVYLYNFSSGNFTAPADVSTPFGDGKGFAVYFFNNADAGSAVLPVRLDAAGAQPEGDVTVTLNPAAFGATLVGNPYASNFQADATNLFFAGDGDFQNNITFWNDGAGSYSVQDRTAPYIIRPWQGFWVERGATGGASTLTFKTTGKTTLNATGAFFSKGLAQTANRADLRFTLTSGSSYDEAIRLSLRDNATTGYDADDASKLIPLLPAYAIMGFRSNDMLKSVESLPWGLTESLTIPMEQILVGVDGGFALAWKGMESFPSGWDLTLHDYQTGVDTDMRADSSYTFDATAPAAKVSPLTLFDQLAPTLKKLASTGTRFALTVNPNADVVSTETDHTPLEFSLDQNYPNPFNPSTTIGYSLREAGPVSLSIYTMNGQRVATLVNESQPAGQHRHSWDARGFASGVYYYRLRANGMDVTKKMTLIK